jgi:hypothetical protein
MPNRCRIHIALDLKFLETRNRGLEEYDPGVLVLRQNCVLESCHQIRAARRKAPAASSMVWRDVNPYGSGISLPGTTRSDVGNRGQVQFRGPRQHWSDRCRHFQAALCESLQKRSGKDWMLIFQGRTDSELRTRAPGNSNPNTLKKTDSSLGL